jgi:hypothetical protein
MHLRIAEENFILSLRLALIPAFIFALISSPACTFYGEHPARSMEEATGGEGLERVFWKNIQTANWVEVERSIASNYAGVGPSGTLDRAAALEKYRGWQLKDYAIGDLKTELNTTTIVVTYNITLNGTTGSQPLPTTPQHMLTVWQQQKARWVMIAQSVASQ